MVVHAKFDEMMDDTILRGEVADDPHLSSSGDGDWCLHVRPAPGWEKLLRNPDGFFNGNSYIECEVEPPDDLPGGNDAESGDAVVKKFVGPLKWRPVRVVGTWTRDRSHTVDGSTVLLDVGGAGDKGKTEIHPITSLLAKLQPPNSKTRRFVFLVFSDDSGGIPPPGGGSTIPPHSGENRHGDFWLAVPSGSTITKVEEHASKAGSALTVTTQAKGSFSYVTGAVTSGKPADGKGFYHLVFDVPALFSLRAFFDSEAFRATAPLIAMPPECKAIADKYHDLERRIGDKVSQQIKDGLDPMDAPGIEELKKDKSKALQQLHACMEKRRNLRSVLPVTPDPCAGILLELEKLRQGRKFDKDLKEWIDVPASPAQIAALEKELVECRKKNLPPPKSLKSLIESAYP